MRHRDDEPDHRPLGCPEARELVSAAADDELERPDRHRLGLHLEDCVDCAGYADEVAALKRSVGLRPADVRVDVVERVMSRAGGVTLGRGGWLRPALAWCGVIVAVQSISPLVFADLDGAAPHVARHVGASALALAVGFLFAAWRPHRAAGMLPFVAALLATTVVGATLDTMAGERAAMAESVHIAEVAGLVLLWLVAGSPGWERLRSGRLHLATRRVR